MSKLNTQEILPELVSIGINFGRNPPKKPADVEQTLLRAIPFLQEDMKLIFLLVTWVMEMGDLVHVERLKSLAKGSPHLTLAFLGGIAEFAKAKFKNWSLISTFVQGELPANYSHALASKMSLPVDCGQVAADENFKKFGLILPKIIIEASSKLIPRKYLVEDNLRFRLRALFGSNWRADVAYLLAQNEKMNAYQIAQELHCSYETAHRLRRGLTESHFNKLRLG